MGSVQINYNKKEDSTTISTLFFILQHLPEHAQKVYILYLWISIREGRTQ